MIEYAKTIRSLIKSNHSKGDDSLVEDYAKKMKQQMERKQRSDSCNDANEQTPPVTVGQAVTMIIVFGGFVFLMTSLSGEPDYTVFMTTFFFSCAVSGILGIYASKEQGISSMKRSMIIILAILIFVGGFVLAAELSEWVWRNW